MNFVSRHPIEGHLAAHGAIGSNHLSIPRTRALWSVLAHGGYEAAAAVGAALSAIAGASVRICGPQEWLVVTDAAQAADVDAVLTSIPGASVVEQSAGRTVLVLSGPDIRGLLAKGTAVDLHPQVFAVGQSTNAQVFHASGNLARVADETYELVVMRSFALFVFEEIRLLGREFGLTASFSD